MESGFTLVELLVVITITAIIAAVVATAYPAARSAQTLTLAEQTLQAALRRAEQAAINEERDIAKCTPRLPPALQKLCSDTGIILEPDKSVMIIFADINQPNLNMYEPDRDFKIAEVPFPDGVRVEPSVPPTTFIFEGAPPGIKLFTSVNAGGCSAAPCEITDSIKVTLLLGDATRELNVGSYGQVERSQ
jgi:prepilin-type N-terminal cleavage/methylation domain-containing protein